MRDVICSGFSAPFPHFVSCVAKIRLLGPLSLQSSRFFLTFCGLFVDK